MRRRGYRGLFETRVLLGVVLLGGVRAGLAAPQEVQGEAVASEKVKAVQNDPLLNGTDRFAQGATDVTEVNLDKGMMAMAAKFMEKSDVEAQQLMKKMDFVNVKAYQYAKAGGYRMGDLDQFRSRLDEAQWSHVVKERSATEATDVWIKADSEGQMSELLVIAAEPTELTFVHLKGRMSMEELTKAGANYGVPQSSGKLQKRGK